MYSSYYEKVGDEVTCIDKELPFEIPFSWEWLRLEDCCSKEIRRGKAPKYSESSGILVFAQKCNTKYNGIDTSLALNLDESISGRYTEDEYLQSGDTVINSTGTGTLGRVGFYQDKNNSQQLPIVPDSHVTVIRPQHALQAFFVYAYMKSRQPEIESYGEGSTNQKELKPAALKWMLVPIPPAKEQIRIVSAIHATMASLDVIEGNLK